MSWEQDNQWESDWWGDCVNTLREEFLQFAYAKRMGLTTFKDDRTEYNIDGMGKSIIDFGGGPISMLLKVRHAGTKTVVDPCCFPMWVPFRYSCADICYLQIKAEEYDGGPVKQYDEAWIYNVLQHVVSPEKVLRVAQRTAKKIRIFEWIDAGTSPGHPHVLTAEFLDGILKGTGTVEQINEHGAIGRCYYGVFET